MRRLCSAAGAATTVIAMLVLAAPASAFVVRWFDHDVNYFAGLHCGDTDQVSVVVGSKAFDVTVVQPKVGTKLTDENTGRTDATITSIRRAGGQVIFTAKATDDVCAHPDSYAENGWATTDVHFDVNYETQEQPVYPSACNNPTYRPHRIVIGCTGSPFYIDQIRWLSWAQGSASGIGTAHVETCTTRSCTVKRLRSYPGVTVQLDKLKYCSANTDFEYTRLRYRYTRNRPPGAAVSGTVQRGCAVQ